MTNAQAGFCVLVACWGLGVTFPIALRYLWANEKPKVPGTKLVLVFVALTLGWTFALELLINWLRGQPPDQEDDS